MADNTILDLENMLEASLDDIPEAPDFNNPPAGEYILSCKDACIDKYTKKGEAEEKSRLKIIYAVVSTLSTASNEPPVPDGSLFSETYQPTQQGLSYFKKRVKEIMGASDVAGVSLAEMMASVKGVEFNARITIKKSPNPNNPDSPYENIQLRIIPS